MVKQWKIWEKVLMLDWLIMLNNLQDMKANQVLFHIRYIVKMLLLFTRLNQF